MTGFSFWVLLLPVVFMIHDFEEIIFFKSWISRNEDILIQKFPQLSHFVSRYKNLSTATFALGVAEEFILISLVSFGAVYTGYYNFWLALFIGFSIHLLVHIVQWLVFRRYIPAIVTTFLVFPYSIGMLVFILREQVFSVNEILLWGAGGFVVVVINLLLVHKMMGWFSKRQ